LAYSLIIMISASLLLLSTLISVTAGGPLQKVQELVTSDINAILTVLDRVSIGIVKVDADVKLWLGDLENGFRILYDARWVHQDMSTGAEFIRRLPNGTISAWDALRITTPMTSIMRSVDSYTNGLINKKAVIGDLALSLEFITSLQSSKYAAEELSEAIAKKLPSVMAWAVGPVTGLFIRKFDKTAREFGALPGPYVVPPLTPSTIP
jgi:hypothetical protein